MGPVKPVPIEGVTSLNWSDWIPALSTSTVLSAVGVAAGIYFKGRVEKGIQHSFDVKLERVKADMRKSEEQFRSELKEKDNQIVALRTGALSGMAARHGALAKRRMDAAERLWATAVSQPQLRVLAKWSEKLNLDEMIKASSAKNSDGEAVRRLADLLWKSAGLENIEPYRNPDQERPFLSPMSWALFQTYRSVLAYPMIQVVAVRLGTGAGTLREPTEILDLVKTALPDWQDFIDEYKLLALPHLIDVLEEKLLNHLTASLSDESQDDLSIQQAARILKAADKAMATEVPKIIPEE